MTDLFAVKRGEAGSYDPVAEAFSRWSRRSTKPIAARLARLVGDDARRVADLGCGSGVVAEALLDRSGPERRVVGVDLSMGMLATAHRQLGRGMEPVFADMESLPFGDDVWDAAVSLFALLHLPCPAAALSEARRVLRPRGELVVAVGSGPPRRMRFLSALLRRGVERALVRAGRRIEAPALLEELVGRRLEARTEAGEAKSNAPLGDRGGADTLAGLVRGAGFVDVRESWVSSQLELSTGADLWELEATFSTVARRRLAEADPEAVRVLREEHEARCRRVLQRGGRLVYPVGALVVQARRAPCD